MTANIQISRALPATRWLILVLVCCSTAIAEAAPRHREMRRAKYALENALTALKSAQGRFGGHRDQALELTSKALQEVKEALKDDKGWY